MGVGNMTAEHAKVFFDLGIVFLNGAKKCKNLAGFGFEFLALKGLQ